MPLPQPKAHSLPSPGPVEPSSDEATPQPSRARVLVVDDDPITRRAIVDFIRREGFTLCAQVGSLAEARRELETSRPDVLLCDLVLPDGQGTDLLAEHRRQGGTAEFILITDTGTVASAVEALRLGAYDYLTRPIDSDRLRALIHGLLRTLDLEKEVTHLRGELRQLGRFGSMVGTSAAMHEVYDLIERVAPTDATVFLVGESGTGKEMAAEMVHRMSRRRQAPFLPLNCGAISPNLIESELFGHERGSFTGAERQHRGYFERASGGSLFLDEITEMPIELQVRLLRVLENSRVLRVGAHQEIEVDVRVIAATNRDPVQAVAEGLLREDLYYRLQVFPLEMPPLREREGDIEHLALHFMAELNRQHGQQIRMSRRARRHLASLPWPGNVRELRNTIERTYILADDEITIDCLPDDLVPGNLPPHGGRDLRLRVGHSLAEAEKRLILATLDELGGRRKEAARMLGISPKTLYNRLARYQREEAAEARATHR